MQRDKCNDCDVDINQTDPCKRISYKTATTSTSSRCVYLCDQCWDQTCIRCEQNASECVMGCRMCAEDTVYLCSECFTIAKRELSAGRCKKCFGTCAHCGDDSLSEADELFTDERLCAGCLCEAYEELKKKAVA
jgi:hypothetical protein